MKKLDAQITAHMTFNSFSICFSIVIAIFAVYHRLNQHLLSKLMLAIVLIEVIYQSSHFMLLISFEKPFQIFRFFIVIYCDLARNTIIFLITFKYYDIIKRQSLILHKKRNNIMVWCIILGYPLIMASLGSFLLFYLDKLKCHESDCEMSLGFNIVYYLLLFIAIISALCLSGVTSYFLVQQTKRLYEDYGSENEQLCAVYKIFAWKIWIYPAASAISLLLICLNSFGSFVSHRESIAVLKDISLFFKGISGLIFSVLFVICDQNYLNAIKSLCKRAKDDKIEIEGVIL